MFIPTSIAEQLDESANEVSPVGFNNHLSYVEMQQEKIHMNFERYSKKNQSRASTYNNANEVPKEISVSEIEKKSDSNNVFSVANEAII